MNNETQTKETAEEEQSVTLQEEVQKKTFGERVATLLGSVGIETKQSKIMIFCMFAVVSFSVLVSFFLLPPFDFPQDKIIVIKSGASLGQVSLLFRNEHLIRSRTLFEFCVMTVGGDKGVHAGQYLFKTPVGACALAFRLAEGVSGIPAIRVTIPEGTPNKEVAAILGEKLFKFDTAFFFDHTRPFEGYLFPDTYFLSGGATPQEVEAVMRTNFDKKTEGLKTRIASSGHSLRDIVIMASILEREATTDADRELVAGVLWKRIKNGMPLQVDAPFLYLLGKKSGELTQSDLQIKSAYNTYRNLGLPGGPIGNPGLATIRASAMPKESPYLYYLSDDKGMMHYAKTFEEHKMNKEKYLK
ncbi:MAG: endolytic transglycosylase MltG [Candidatus Yonathbacteria bacterium]|nr:endolytic transglycosylase MltG [Candidatus Yonathbacteria bacterium]